MHLFLEPAGSQREEAAYGDLWPEGKHSSRKLSETWAVVQRNPLRSGQVCFGSCRWPSCCPEIMIMGFEGIRFQVWLQTHIHSSCWAPERRVLREGHIFPARWQATVPTQAGWVSAFPNSITCCLSQRDQPSLISISVAWNTCVCVCVVFGSKDTLVPGINMTVLLWCVNLLSLSIADLVDFDKWYSFWYFLKVTVRTWSTYNLYTCQ